MQGSEVLKEFKELNERKVNEKLIETILRLWPCDQHKLKAIKIMKEE